MEKAPGKLNPIQRIAQELEPHSSLPESDIERALVGIMEMLKDRAEDEIQEDADSEDAEDAAMQFLAFTEMMTMFGGSLLAYDQVEQPEASEEMKN